MTATQKLDPYRHLFGKVSAEKLAEMADVSVTFVRIEVGKAKKAASEHPAETPPAPPVTEQDAPSPPAPSDVSSQPGGDVPPEVPAEEPPAPEDPIPPAPEDTPAPAEPCPSAVRVVRRLHVLRAPPNGMPRRFGFGDLFGALHPQIRDWLWGHHRGHVEPFKP